MKAEKKKLGFGGGLMIYLTVLLTILFVGLALWWHYLDCYEADRVLGVMDQYMAQFLESELKTEIDTYSIAQQRSYQSAEEISAVLYEALSGDNWQYREHPVKSTEQAPVFTLFCGGLAVGEARLTAGEEQPMNMGFGTWQTPDAEFNFAQFGKNLVVTAPYGCEVLVDGQALTDDQVAETIGLYPQLEAYEALITEPNQLLVYRIEEVFTEVAVEFSPGYTLLKGEQAGTIYALPVCEDALAEELIEYCKGFVGAYVEYTANANSLWLLQQYLVPDSQLYNELTAASSGLNWGHGVNAVLGSVEIKNFVYYGNAITCQASYSMTRDDGDRSEVMNLLLVNTEDGWRVNAKEINEQKTGSPAVSPGSDEV